MGSVKDLGAWVRDFSPRASLTTAVAGPATPMTDPAIPMKAGLATQMTGTGVPNHSLMVDPATSVTGPVTPMSGSATSMAGTQEPGVFKMAGAATLTTGSSAASGPTKGTRKTTHSKAGRGRQCADCKQVKLIRAHNRCRICCYRWQLEDRITKGRCTRCGHHPPNRPSRYCRYCQSSLDRTKG